ncbi:MAG: ABC transporter ATP-binding protein [Flavobacteriales bacterium]|jgi:lipoprotein-releasing system ATP-binding protein|nr:ABC transporter ATP-binding protein [Flavobacteriales bacterium]MDG1176486.1 ABC transporter ATP-binding protein [Flavobacteriales bacterium]|tara:strand:- start:285 stop:935 length:651 start_codon:yes stop_codon:yes gene_type:complete
MIKVSSVTKSFGSLQVLKGVDLEIQQGEIVSIVGASGAGKTTLLQLIGTLDNPDSGNINFLDTNVNALSKKELARFRNKNIGFVFQFHHLLPEFTALENVCIPGYLSNTPKKEVEERAAELLEMLGLKDRINHKPSELSGGEQQRVSVARALINNPSVILADEPSGNLDSQNAEELHNLFFSLRDKFNQTFVIVTHNNILSNMSDRKLVMKDGVII